MAPSYGGYQQDDTILQLIMRQGQIQAEGAQRSGAIWGDAFADIGKTLAGGLEKHAATQKVEEEKAKLKARDAAFAVAVESWDGKDPKALLGSLTMFDPKTRLEMTNSVVAFQSITDKGDDRDWTNLQQVAKPLIGASDELLTRWGPGLQAKAAPLLAQRYGGDPARFTEPATPAQIREMAQMIAGKTEEDYTLAPGQQRRRGGQVIAENPAAAPTPPNLQHVETARGIQSFNPQTGQLGPVIAPGRPSGEGQPPNLQHIETADGIRTFNPRTGAVGPVVAQPKPSARATRPPTGAERRTLNFLNRMLEAEKNARAVEDKIGARDFAAEAMPGDFLENLARSPEGQQYKQAQSTFTEGRLRKESGAAIPPHEYTQDRDTNFRRPNDSEEVLKQKRAARLTTIRGAANEAGKALEEFYGEGVTIDDLLRDFETPAGPAAPPTAPGAERLPLVNSPAEAARLPKGTRFRTPDGQVRVVP